MCTMCVNLTSPSIAVEMFDLAKTMLPKCHFVILHQNLHFILTYESI